MRLWCVKPDKFLFTSMIGFHGMAGRLDRVKETLQEMDAAGFKPDRVTTLLLLGEILSTQTTVEKLEETMAVLASSGVVVDVAHWTTALRHFRQHGDFAGLVRVWKAMSVPPDDIAVTLMVKAYADFGNASQLLEFLKDIPQDLLGQSSTWSAVISAFSRQWGWGSDGDLDSRDAAFGLSCAVLDQVPVKAEALPAALREEFPFVGLRPPIPEAGLMLVIFDLATRLRGERGQIITEKGRGYLVRNGHRVPDGADARAMLATVKLSLPGSRPRQRRR
ncbi:hypothetical protein DFJ74DRAFT_654467 [Hyaloraphidium curvatum]|nr:hypothetical protein DFJ74DRAFT_654467 [Hyaloraphidium curvatum]